MKRFGRVEFDIASRRLRVGGRPVALDRSCLAILAALFEANGEDVHKDRLLKAGWPGRVVHENSLAKAIGRLRQALGDDGRALETVHGHGYRLVTGPEVAGPPPETLSAPGWARRHALLLGALGIVTGGGLWLQFFAGEVKHLNRGEPADAVGRVLWVDDHPENNAPERSVLEGRKVAVYQVTTTEDALALLAMYDYDAVISDMNRNDKPLEGLRLVREMRARKDATPFYLYTVVPSAAQRKLLVDAGGQGIAVTSDALYAAITPLLGKRMKPSAY